TMQSRQQNYQDSPQAQQQNYQDTRPQGPNDRNTLQSRQRQAMEPNSMGSNSMDRNNMGPDSERTRPRETHRVTVIRRMARRPTARMENTAGDENTNTEYLRSAAGPSNVAETAPPPQ